MYAYLIFPSDSWCKNRAEGASRHLLSMLHEKVLPCREPRTSRELCFIKAGLKIITSQSSCEESHQPPWGLGSSGSRNRAHVSEGQSFHLLLTQQDQVLLDRKSSLVSSGLVQNKYLVAIVVSLFIKNNVNCANCDIPHSKMWQM